MGTPPLAGPARGPRSPLSHPARRGLPPPQLPSSQADQQSYTSWPKEPVRRACRQPRRQATRSS